MADKISNGILAAILAAMTAISAVSCLMTGFKLEVDAAALIVIVACLAAVLGAVCFSRRHGTAIVTGILAVAAFFLLCAGEALDQITALITRLSYTYDQAYQWGVLRFSASWYNESADYPLVILAALIALAVTWVLCSRKPAVLALIAAVLPLSLCLVVTDTLPKNTCVFFLLVGVIGTLVRASIQKRDDKPTPVYPWIASMAVFAAVAVLFAAVPQAGYRNPFASIQNQILEALGLEGYGMGASGGEIDGVDLRGLGSRFFLQYAVMTVTAPEDGTLYLREQDFNIYTGYSWESDEDRSDGMALMPFRDTEDAQKLTIETKWVRRRLMLPYYVTGMVHLTDGVLANPEKDQSYTWSVIPLEENWKEQIPNEYVLSYPSKIIDRKYYHSLPVETQRWAQRLLADVLTDEQSATAKADTIAAYVRESALYEDDCKRMPIREKDFAKWFMTDGESGYCVHFATSTAVLLRAADVDTRYVTGYMVDVTANEPTTVTADMEHAWVEYYEPALDKWIPLESTPAELEEEEEEEETTRPTTPTTSPNTPNVTRPTQSATPDETESSIPWKEIFLWGGRVLLCVLAVAAVVALVLGQRRFREARRQRRWTRSSQNERALMLWREILRMMRRLESEPSEALYALAQKAKFSHHTLTDDELQVFNEERERCIAQLRTRSWVTRFVHRYVLYLY